MIRVAWLAAGIGLFAAGCANKQGAPRTTSAIDAASPPQGSAPMTKVAARPVALRRVLKPSPEFLAKHVTGQMRSAAREYLAGQAALPDEIRRAIENGEVWLGMTETEIRLVLGPPSSTEAIGQPPDQRALVYGDEGWVLSFDARGYLYELVER